MGSYYENLDVIIQTYRLKHTNAYDNDSFVRATKWLYAMNCAHPSKAFLNDMPKFSIRGSNNIISIRTRLNIESKARAYCDQWLDKLELAMTDFREKNQEKWNRV
jgi:hypothetical protein